MFVLSLRPNPKHVRLKEPHPQMDAVLLNISNVTKRCRNSDRLWTYQ